jgi:uncharacterized protein YbaR (Trm112 family)
VSSKGPLACPRCAKTYPLDERFCPECGMPLTYAGRGEQEPITDAQERARKIKPQYTEGELVRVAGGRNQAEAELIQGMLLEEGIPSILRRTRGFDVPDFLAAGPRDVMVPEAGYEPARQLLLDAEMGSEDSAGEDGIPGIGSPARLLTWVLVGLAGAAVLVWLLYQATA